jgi:hypothetical protein
MNGDNVALRPEFVRTSLRLEAAHCAQIDGVVNDGGRVICDLREVAPDGSLTWNARPGTRVVRPGGSRAVLAGDRILFQGPIEIEAGIDRYRVDAGFTLEGTETGVIVRDPQGGAVQPLDPGLDQRRISG